MNHAGISRFLSSSSGGWQKLEPGSEQPQTLRKETLSALASSTNFVALCGLGTSLCLRSAEGQKLAPTMTDLWTHVSRDPDFSSIRKKVNLPAGDENIEHFLSRCQLATALAADRKITDFIRRAEAAIVDLCRFVRDETDLNTHQLFLRKAARRSTRLPRLRLFTTNYDLAFEAAASRSGFIAVDGFSHSSPSIFDGAHFDYDFVRRDDDRGGPEYIPNVFHLYKIHGSVDWENRNGRIQRAEVPPSPLIIYPRSSKFESSYDPPFLEMMSRLQVALRLPNTSLIVCGFGFNDEHIAQPVMAAIRSNVSLRVAVVSPTLAARGKSGLF